LHKIKKYLIHNNKLSYDEILRSCSFSNHDIQLIVFDKIDSTNNWILTNSPQLISSNNRILIAVVAEYQSSGRGRQGRTWFCETGNCLTFSVLRHFKKKPSLLSGLSLVIGLAIIRTLKAFSIINIQLKWPNDILYEKKKLAGILIEIRVRPDGTTFAAIGIGVNFYLSDPLKQLINQEATDLFEITGYHLDRNQVLGKLLTELKNMLDDFETYGFLYFRNEWIKSHAYEGCEVTLKLPTGETIDGAVDGIDDSGALKLITNSGIRTFNIGDISLRLKAES